MTFLITSDWHLSDNPRDEYRHAWQKRLRKLIEDRQVRTLFILGDLTEEKDRHSAQLTNRIADHLVALSQLCDDVVILRGNHDATDPECPFFGFVSQFPQVTWVNKWREWKGILLLPHTTNYERDWPLREIRKAKLVFAHATFKGSKTETGQELDGIPTSIFHPEAQVIAGDIHTPQRIGPVVYVGAPYTVDFGDQYVPQVYLLDKGGKRTAVRLSGPQKRLVELTHHTGDAFKTLEEQIRGYRGINEGDILKVRVEIGMAGKAKWSELRDEVRATAEKLGYIVHLVQPVLEKDDKQPLSSKRKVRRAKSDGDLLQAYAKLRSLDERTLKTGQLLMQEQEK